MWEFEVLDEEHDAEMTALGATVRPVVDAAFDAERNGYFLRGFNGQLYGVGKTTAEPQARARFHKGDKVRFELDGETGTLSIWVNATPLGECFRGLFGKELYPAIGFAGPDKVVRLLSAATVTAFPRAAAGGAGAAAAGSGAAFVPAKGERARAGSGSVSMCHPFPPPPLLQAPARRCLTPPCPRRARG
jgi:hypothetical protein